MTPAQRIAIGLLGSSGHDISCAACFRALDAYVDGELETGAAPDSMAGMTGHLGNCPACHEEYESLRALACEPPRQ